MLRPRWGRGGALCFPMAAANAWDFSKWTPDAVVINLGTNDHLGTNASTARHLKFYTRTHTHTHTHTHIHIHTHLFI